MSVIALDGLTKRFGDIVAVDDLTVQLGRGRVIGLLGPNGAGKTTTLRLLLGLVAPTSGSATIDGQPYRALDEPIRRVGAVLEATSFHPGRRARDHLRVLATTAGIADQRVDEVLAEVGLERAARRRVGGFSLGMRQRLGLAAALLGDPDVLVLDEPTNGLDPEGIHWLRDFLRAYAASGRTVLVSSHLLAEVAQTVDEVVVLTGGRLVAHAPLSELLRGRTVVRIRTPDAAALRAALDARGIHAELRDPVTRIGVMLEAASHPARTARNHLRVLATESGIPASRADEMLELVDLGDAARRRSGGFSLGMTQRLGLAAALLGDPRILVLDEPANGLDPEGIRWLRDFLRAYAASGRTVLVSSHLLAEVAQTVDEVVVLTGGRLVAHAPLSELLRGRTVVRVRTPDAAALRTALDARGIHAELSTADLVLAHGATSEAVGRAIAATGLVAYEISQQHRDLEQAFLDLTTTTTGAPQ
ncbi:MAG TPA: ATP-binding cassette domain-containing protein [Acidimicrobiales bacterium]|nr:ATP-binding cassette domain-containing protein [Acidimicrobiales bacterium]